MLIDGDYRRLTREEERELALERPRLGPEAWKTSEARRTLIECNIPWAKKLAKTRGNRRMGWDKWGVAFLGLVKAVDAFDPAKGRITTLAERVIRNDLRRAWMDYNARIHVPENVRQYIDDIKAGREPKVRRPGLLDSVPYAKAAMSVWSIERPMTRHGQNWTEELVWRDDTRPGGASDAQEFDDIQRLYRAIDKLPAELAEIVRMHHFREHGALSIEDIAKSQGITSGKAYSKLYRAHAHLRMMLRRTA